MSMMEGTNPRRNRVGDEFRFSEEVRRSFFESLPFDEKGKVTPVDVSGGSAHVEITPQPERRKVYRVFRTDSATGQTASWDYGMDGAGPTPPADELRQLVPLAPALRNHRESGEFAIRDLMKAFNFTEPT